MTHIHKHARAHIYKQKRERIHARPTHTHTLSLSLSLSPIDNARSPYKKQIPHSLVPTSTKKPKDLHVIMVMERHSLAAQCSHITLGPPPPPPHTHTHQLIPSSPSSTHTHTHSLSLSLSLSLSSPCLHADGEAKGLTCNHGDGRAFPGSPMQSQHTGLTRGHRLAKITSQKEAREKMVSALSNPLTRASSRTLGRLLSVRASVPSRPPPFLARPLWHWRPLQPGGNSIAGADDAWLM